MTHYLRTKFSKDNSIFKIKKNPKIRPSLRFNVVKENKREAEYLLGSSRWLLYGIK